MQLALSLLGGIVKLNWPAAVLPLTGTCCFLASFWAECKRATSGCVVQAPEMLTAVGDGSYGEKAWSPCKQIFLGFRFRREVGVGQNEETRGPQVLVAGSIYQGSIVGTYS